MEAKGRISLDGKIALAVFAVVLAIYLFTLCPGIYLGPSAEAVCDVKGAGLRPPVLHPAWLILGRVFSAFGSNTAFLLNVLSALFGALTVGLMYMVVSQFAHARTAEEEARYQTHPYFRQVAALCGVLLVAFSYPFWEGSVLAGPDTLNTFLLVLVVFLIARYAKTSKARYVMLFGLVYGLAITNYPTLLLLAPIFLVFLLVRGRALLDDPVAFVVTVLLFVLGLAPALYIPQTYVLEGKSYVKEAETFGQALFAYIDSYFRWSMKNLFLQKSALQDWIFWLFLPSFVPILFFMMRKGDYEHGSEMATRVTYLVRYVFVVLFTIGGLGYLLGFLIGPVGMAELDFLQYPRYLGSYVVVGAWFTYVVGYWMIVATGKFKPTGAEPVPKHKYRTALYIAAVVVALALPVAELVMSYGKSTKRGAYYVEDFANGILKSCPEEAILVVPEDPFFGSIGAPLRYAQAQMQPSLSGGKRAIVDLNAAFFDFHLTKRIDTARYLAETVTGRKVEQPRLLFLPESPFSQVYDLILRCETRRAREANERPRPICGLVNNFFLAYLRGRNNLMNADYRAEPAGLVYAYRNRAEYREAAKLVEDNERIWGELTFRSKAGKGRISTAEDVVLSEYSKSANDSGVFCHLAGRLDLAERHYRRALEWLPENSSALLNLSTLLAGKGETGEADELLRKHAALVEQQQKEDVDFIRKFGLSLDIERLVATEKSLAEEKGAEVEGRRLGILRLAADMMPGEGSVRERTGDILFASERPFALQEAQSEYVAALERTDPKDREQTRRIQRKLGRVYARQGQNEKAERIFRSALAEGDPSTFIDLIEFVASAGQNLAEVNELATSVIKREEPADEQGKAALARAKVTAAGVLVKVMVQAGQMEEAKQFLPQFLKNQPGAMEMVLTLAEELRRDARFDAFTAWLYEEYRNLGNELTVPRLVSLAEVLLRQKRYEDVIAMAEPPAAVRGMEVAQFYHFKATAYDALAQHAEAEKTLERAKMLLPPDSGNFGTTLINNLAWRYSKSGKTEEAKKLAEEALSRDPANSLVWDTCGWILYRAGGDFKKAFELIERSHVANPDVGSIAYHYGKVLMDAGEKERGMAVLEMAVGAGIEEKEELEDAQEILKKR